MAAGLKILAYTGHVQLILVAQVFLFVTIQILLESPDGVVDRKADIPEIC